MKLFVFMFLSMVSLAHSGVSIEVIPQNPAVNEVFQILFKCSVDNKQDPEINFDPKNFEVLGKQSQGLSTRTTYQAGKITVTRELLVSYSAIAKKTGTAVISNPRIKIGNKTISKDDLSFQVVSKPVGPRLVFVSAEVSSDDVYENEGITLRYYLYRKVGIQATDIKKYPKLDDFMKRYLQENENPQRVNMNGDIFTRSTLYSARLYPEKSGEYEIDPLEISVSYSNDNFGGFGLGFGLSGRDLVTKVIASEPIKIKVKPLPTEGRPSNFSGLVGVHKFDISFGRTNILINEPLEIKLSINGPGKLEGLSAFRIFDSPAVERFDVKADLAIINSESAVKTFGYTFLGKNNGDIPQEYFEIIFFNPESKKYESWKTLLPEIRIAGGQAEQPNTSEAKPLANTSERKLNPETKIVLVQSDSMSKVVLLVFFLTSVALVFYKFSGLFNLFRTQKDSNIDKTIKHLRSGDYGHKEIAQFITHFEKNGSGGARDLIRQSRLDASDKDYFYDIINKLDHNIKNGSSESLPKIDQKLIKKISSLYETKNANS